MSGTIQMLASDSRIRPRVRDIIEVQTKGKPRKELIYPILYIWNFIYSLLFSTIQPELGSVSSPPGEAEAVD